MKSQMVRAPMIRDTLHRSGLLRQLESNLELGLCGYRADEYGYHRCTAYLSSIDFIACCVYTLRTDVLAW